MIKKSLLTMGALAALLAACTDEYNVAPGVNMNDANRPSAGQVELSVAGSSDTRAEWDGDNLRWNFVAGDKIAALLMDEWNQENEGNTTIADYTFLDYIHTNYPFTTTDGVTFKTPDDAALCEGNYFFVWPYDGTYKYRGHVGFGLNNKQYNVDENGSYDLWAAVKENQKYLGYAFIPATTEDVNKVDVTFHPIFAAPKFKLQNMSGMDLRLIKLIVRTHQDGPAGAPALMPDSVVLAPLSKNFAEVNVDYANGELTSKEETAALFSHATLVQNGFFAQTTTKKNIKTDVNKGVYEYTIEFGDNYIVSTGEFFKACAVMPAGEYWDFDVFALVEEQNSEKTTGVVELTSLKSANWTGFDSQNGSMQTVLKPGITQIFSANFDAEAIGNLGLENFTVANSEDLAWILDLKAEYGGKDLLVIKTLGDQVEMTDAVYNLLANENRKGIKVQIDGTIVIPATAKADAIDQLTTGQAGAYTTIINKGVQTLTKDLVNTDVINEGTLTGDVTITGDVTNKGTLTVTKIVGDLNAEAGTATVAVVANGDKDGIVTVAEGAEVTITESAVNVKNSGKVTTKGIIYWNITNNESGEWIVNGVLELLNDGKSVNKGQMTVEAGATVNVSSKEGLTNEGTIDNNCIINSLYHNKAEGIINNNGTLTVAGNYGDIHNSGTLTISYTNEGWIYEVVREADVFFADIESKNDGYIENTVHANIQYIPANQHIVYTADGSVAIADVLETMANYKLYTDLYIKGNYTLKNGEDLTRFNTGDSYDGSKLKYITIFKGATLAIATGQEVTVGWAGTIDITNDGTIIVNHNATMNGGAITNNGTIRRHNSGKLNNEISGNEPILFD